ncbi:bifunctional aspartate kinase/homoserine dehydrogenase I [Marinoscillum sp. 108]|jgi:aspartokinase/homoserine dehydrogenase 1|uniref:Bifunctional aspartate kinase/homoserine dehydrogenase I n=1 Tax=Marinoscillum luteum TaxID=861051 RepID=A0ABW7NE70_9BACT|nr:bifunctional aspartate kinase/homoserine dehydrogenase I [Marinoscillum sp. 108]VXD14537.1 Aspartate kinase [Marinoscillum sp. 108]
MKVLKFGGTSVGSEEAIRQVARIVHSSIDQLVLVTSAVGGVTDQLVHIGELAASGRKDYASFIEGVKVQHEQLYYNLIENKPDEQFYKIIEEFEDICKGVWLLRELTPRSADYIYSTGERLSTLIISEFFRNEGIDVTLYDSRDYIITDDHFGHAHVDFKETTKRLKEVSKTFSKVNLFPGFIASTADNQTTTLGRGGSDYSAAILAGVLDADHFEVWTDVDGLMTADPRMVKRAHFIEHVSYEEALELSHFGAKVIYPPSIQPALEKGISITIKNTFNPEHPGTLITKEWDQDKELIRGISSIKDISLVTLSGNSMVGVPKFSYRFFRALSEAHINVILITQSSSEHSITVGIDTKDSKAAVKALNAEFEEQIENHKIDPIQAENNLSIIALVGSNMKNQVGVSGQMFNVLGKNGVSIKAIAQGSSERNISAVIAKDDLNKALNVLHESFFLSVTKRINLFIIGTGNVGKAFIQQLVQQFTYLKKHHQLNIKIIGLGNSRLMHFENDGIPLSKWESILQAGEKYSSEQFLEKMYNANLRNSIFIDITASEDVAGLYPQILKKSISVVTPNKIAATGSYADYLNLKGMSRRYGSRFLFETNVCAGLPVLSTLSDLVRSGDQIHQIEAVLSGTLVFLFNEYNGKTKFVDVIKKAKQLGYTEPDPRLDLFGSDVKRKIVILIRESGYKCDYEDIQLNSFLPESCLESNSVEDFYTKVEKEEAHFKNLYEAANKEGKRLKVVAKYKNGHGSVGLEAVDSAHPFYNLEGKDNIVLFYTNRYKEQPMVIKGAGAGAEVTASGIFADVLRLAQTD